MKWTGCFAYTLEVLLTLAGSGVRTLECSCSFREQQLVWMNTSSSLCFKQCVK